MRYKRGHRVPDMIRNLAWISSGAVSVALWGCAEAALAGPLVPLKDSVRNLVSDPIHAFSLLLRVQNEPADFRVGDVTGSAGRPIPINIDVLQPGDKEAGQLFIFTGLPEGAKLNPGGKFGDFWAVNADVIENLTLITPENFAGSFTVKITRTRNESTSARSATIKVTIGEPPTVQTAAPSNAPGVPRERNPNEQKLIARATELLNAGDVSAARSTFEYLVMQGSPAAAVAMGETYDPIILGKLLIKGLEADAKKAQQWYEKAEELGSSQARSRLNALATR